MDPGVVEGTDGGGIVRGLLTCDSGDERESTREARDLRHGRLQWV